MLAGGGGGAGTTLAFCLGWLTEQRESSSEEIKIVKGIFGAIGRPNCSLRPLRLDCELFLFYH